MNDEMPIAGATTNTQVQLRILETTDLHVHIMPYDYFADKPAPTVGLARTASLIRTARAEAVNCLLFDNGDFLQGSPMSDWAATNANDAVHPMIAAMNTLEYDGATLGNHEFNYGLQHLIKAVEDANFPIVSANITTAQGDSAAQDDTLVAPWKILPKQVQDSQGNWHNINIGIIGFAPPQIADWERYTLDGKISTRDIIEAAKAHIPRLQAAGADIIIALSHSGIGAEDHTPGMENASVPLAAVGGIDALLTGHTHGVFPGGDFHDTSCIDATAGTIHGVPTVMAGYHGSHLGIIDLNLTKSDAGWTVASHRSQAAAVIKRRANTSRPIVVETDDAVVTSTQETHDLVLDHIRLPLTYTTRPISSHFSTVAPSAILTLLANALTAGAQNAMHGLPGSDLPMLAAVAPYKAGGWGQLDDFVDIPAGPIAMRNAAEFYPYPNPLCVLQLTGADIKDWLETSALAFAQIKAGVRDQPLLGKPIPSYNRDSLHGLTYVIDPTAAPNDRISDIRLKSGKPLGTKDVVAVATNGYRAAGGGGYRAAPRGESLFTLKTPVIDVLIDHLRLQPVINPIAEQVWRFPCLPDTAAWFTSGPTAAAHLQNLDVTNITEIGPLANGFVQFSYDFGKDG